ncbi:isoaspartyl peptidase/L-asparaginase family protein [Brevundimonas aveniformis]|uniref:isoaspartyl peptidase/L-asparaginase family protein n=1 Tax=Brevundimonas aveniformis TaxID=370977 RepID=UPI00041C9CCB|nr:isoaspartyl peptidase/L-asparaginase [Brevundimonas aveniformis]
MIRFLCLFVLTLAFAGSAAAQNVAADAGDEPLRWTIAIHGGAGTIERSQMTPERDAEYRAALTAAIEAGSEVLRNGGSSLDAIQASIEVMEDNPMFNAGRGAVFTAEGANSLDAAIMDGEMMRAGAVAGVSRTRHPIALARAVMEQSPHVMLAGEGADAFAVSVGLEQVEPAFFFTQRRWDQLIETLNQRGWPIPERPAGTEPTPGASAALSDGDDHRFGTVGVVAVDSQGRIAAGTSTGGTTAKRWGRIGDTPVIGAGTWAGRGCAVSATGTGEYFIRLTVARDICGLNDINDMPIAEAAEAMISELGAIGGDGGVIALTTDGSVAFSMNTSGMYRGWADQDTAPRVAIYSDEDVLP